MSKRAIQLWTELSAAASTRNRARTPYYYKLQEFSDQQLDALTQDMLAALRGNASSDIQRLISGISKLRFEAMCRDILSEYEERYSEIRPTPPLKPRVASTLAHNFVKRNAGEGKTDDIRINVLEAKLKQLRTQLRRSDGYTSELQKQNEQLARSLREFQILETELVKQRALTDRVRREASLLLFDLHRKRLRHQRHSHRRPSLPLLPDLVDEQYVSPRSGVREYKVKRVQDSIDSLLFAAHTDSSEVVKLLSGVKLSVSDLMDDVDASLFRPHLIVIESALLELKKTMEETSSTTSLHSTLSVDARLTELATAMATLLKRTLIYRPVTTLISREGDEIDFAAQHVNGQPELSRGSSIHELYNVLDREAGDTAEKVRALLAEIKQNAPLSSLSEKAHQISKSLDRMLTATSLSINRSATATLLIQKKITFVIDNIHECQIRMARLENDLSRVDKSSKTDLQIKRRLAAVSYDIARTTNELVNVFSDFATSFV